MDSQNDVDRNSASLPCYPPVLDVCCGPRGFWFNAKDSRAVFVDRRRETLVFNHPSGNRTDTIDPDVLADFTNLPFPDDTFALVVMDPPHIVGKEWWKGRACKRYGVLEGDWREMLRKGFAECFRVLRPQGTFVFKWNECSVPVGEILALTDEPPLFGHRSGKASKTHWVTFMKSGA
jgi:SAM-dependent methyltransferase